MRRSFKVLVAGLFLALFMLVLAAPLGAQPYPPGGTAPGSGAGGAGTGAGGAGAGAGGAGTGAGGLASTGSDSLPLVWIGAGLIAGGTALAIGARRRHQVRARAVSNF